MTAFDAAGIQEAGIATDQRAARESELRQRLQTAGGDGTRAVGDALATLQEAPNFRMCLVALEFLVRRQVWILVGEADHITDRYLVVFQVIQERSAISLAVQRPTGSVNDQSRLMLGRIDIPQFLDADTVGLRVLVLVQVIFVHQLLAQVAAGTFGKQRVFGVQFHPELEGGGWFAIATNAHIAGGDTFDRAIVVVQHFGSSKAGKDFHAQRLSLLSQPAHHVGE